MRIQGWTRPIIVSFLQASINLVTEMVCWATGGPQKYTGRSMKEAHKDLMITPAEWEAFLDDLQQTLDAVQQAEQAELKAIVNSTRADIVV